MKTAKRILNMLLVLITLFGMLAVTAQAATKVTITQQPQSVTVANGVKASVTVKASGTGLTYKWYYKDASATSFTLTTAFKTATYSVEMTNARAGRQVYCVVTDGNGNSVRSATATLNKGTTLKITAQPQSVTVAMGATAKVTVKAQGDGLTYKWYYKDKGATSFTLTTAFKTASYSVSMTDARAGRQVYCVVTDKYGSSVQSATATLNKTGSLAITQQPVSVTVAKGETAKVSFTATGEGLTYTWYYKNKGAASFVKTSTFTGNTYTAEMNATRDGRQIYCVVKDKYGNSVKTNTVTLSMSTSSGPVITQQPVSVTAAKGETAKVSFTATGEGLTYTWYYKNKGAASFVKTSTFTGNTYTAEMNATRDGRQIYCVVKDKNGNSVKTNTVTLTMKNVATITKQPVSVAVAEGATAKVSFTATGDGLTYTWYYKNKSASSFVKTNTFTGNTYTTEMNATRDGRQIYCVVKDKYGNSVKTNTVTLSMGTPLVITAQPQNDRGNPGDQATFTVAVSGGKAPYTYQWQMRDYYRDWEDLTNGSWFTGVNTNRLDLIVDRDESVNENKYRCVITDADGYTVISNAAWVVEDPLRITAQPNHAYVNEFGTATYRVTVTGGVAPYTYKWQQVQGSSVVDITGKYGDGIEKYTGWNTAALTVKITSYDFAYSRKYRCVITDSCGNSVTSEVGCVYNPLRFITQPVDVETLTSRAGFSAKAVGGLGPYTYTWQCYTNTGWSDLTEDMIIKPEGQGTEVLRVLIPNEELFGLQIRCVVTDANGNTAISDTVHVYKSFSADLSHSTLYFDRDDPLVPVTVVVTPGSLKGEGPYTYRWHRWYSDTKTWYSDSTWDPDDNTYNAYWSYDEVTMQVYCEVMDADGNIARTQTLTIYSS